MNPSLSLILFDSIHHVLAAEAVFKEQRVWCDLVPVPKDVSPDCGMAVAFRPADEEQVQAVLSDPRIARHRVHRAGPAGDDGCGDTVHYSRK